MNDLVIRNARVVTPAGAAGPVHGHAMQKLEIHEHTDVAIRDGRIVDVGRGLESRGDEEVDAAGAVLLPGLVDCHTHMCYAGSRLDEWVRRLRGATYLELLGAGGGIMSTVRAVRLASEEHLAELLLRRLWEALHLGSTTIEIKSGYGLNTESELKMLRAIDRAAAKWPGTVVKTACIGHAIDPDEPRAVERTINETLSAVHAEFPGVAIDAYCEKGAWSCDECLRLFDRACELGHPCRVHTDQFHALGMTGAAIDRGFASVDHLEASTPEEVARLGRSPTVAVVLPCSGFHVDRRFADGRQLIDAGAAVAIATNCNPGSAPCLSMPMAMQLAVRFCGVGPREAITAATANAAAALGLTDRGRIAVGQRADLVLVGYDDERLLTHDFGTAPIEGVICGGRVVGGDAINRRLR